MLRMLPGAMALTFLGVACTATPAADTEEGSTALLDETAIDRDVDPCTDFYEFACGRYDARLPAGTDSQPRKFALMTETWLQVHDRVYDRLQHSPRSAAERKAGAFYASCLEDRGETQTASMHAIRAELASAHAPADLARMIARMLGRGWAPLFQVDAVESGRVVSLVARAEAQYETRTEEQLVADAKELLAFHEPGIPAAEAQALGEGYARVNVGLARELGSLPADDGARHMTGLPGLETAAPNVDWRTLLGELGVERPSSTFELVVPSTFAAVGRVIASLPVEDVTAFLTVWIYASTPSSAGSANPPTLCRQVTDKLLSDAVQPAFLEYAGIDEAARTKALAMWSALKSAFAEELAEATWLDEATRTAASRKLAAMEVVFGASKDLDDYATLTLDGAFFDQRHTLLAYRHRRELRRFGEAASFANIDDTTVMNAFYRPDLNLVQVPGAYMGGQIFSVNAPLLANLAGLGTTLGHELTHGFDVNGRNYDDQGREREWWTGQSNVAFDERASCFANQYDTFAVPGTTTPIDGYLTLGENIADNGGLKAAYRAAKLEGRTGPLVAGSSPQQQFFIGYAQSYCGKLTSESMQSLLEKGPHAPDKARVNVPVQNSRPFAEAFECKEGSPMAPKDRCELW